MRNSGNSCILIVLLGLSMGFSVACSRHPSDDKIAKDIEERIATDPDTQDSQVNVSVTEGKVKLKGKVKTPVAQKKIEKIVDAEPGATAMDDQTTIDPELA